MSLVFYNQVSHSLADSILLRLSQSWLWCVDAAELRDVKALKLLLNFPAVDLCRILGVHLTPDFSQIDPNKPETMFFDYFKNFFNFIFWKCYFSHLTMSCFHGSRYFLANPTFEKHWLQNYENILYFYLFLRPPLAAYLSDEGNFVFTTTGCFSARDHLLRSSCLGSILDSRSFEGRSSTWLSLLIIGNISWRNRWAFVWPRGVRAVRSCSDSVIWSDCWRLSKDWWRGRLETRSWFRDDHAGRQGWKLEGGSGLRKDLCLNICFH